MTNSSAKNYNKRKVGSKYENIAREYLEKNGLKCIDKNYFCKFGEIDLIFKDCDIIVFVEVKYRFNKKSGDALEAINYRKQVQISKCAKSYILKNKLSFDMKYRFDAVAINGEEISWVKNAFEYAWI